MIKHSLALVMTAVLALPALAETPRLIKEGDLLQFKWIGDPQLSASGAELAYVLVNVDEKREGYEARVWTVSPQTGASRQLTFGKGDTSPRWSPDGKRLAFLRQSTDKDGKPQPPQLWIMPMDGGEPQQLTRLPKGVGNPRWSPDGKTIAFTSTANEQDLALAKCEEAKKDKCNGVRSTDVQVITRAVYRANGAGYLDFGRPGHIWTIDAAVGAEPKQLTSGTFDEREPTWSHDGSRIFYISDRSLEPYYELPRTAIYAIPVTGGAATELQRIAGRANALALSPDGKKLAYLSVASEPVQSHTKANLWVADVAGGKPLNLTVNHDWEIGGNIINDQPAPKGAGDVLPVWNADSESIVMVVARDGRANLMQYSLKGGAPLALTSGDQAVARYTSNGKELVALISNPVEVNELYMVEGTRQRRLTDVNGKLFAALKLTRPQDVWHKSFDGTMVHTLVQLPPDFDPKKKYPLILNIHGGPHAAYGHTFFHEMQWMAARGYVVAYPNPRGSTTYGEKFANVIQYKYPGDDYKDLMGSVDELIKRGWVDTARMGVTGGSGGGLLTNWTIGKTQRFKAAVSQRDISNWAAWWYSADFTLFQGNWFRKPPFEDPEDYRARSPITYVKNIKTPTMFVLGDADSRTPAEAGGDQMFRALKYLKVPTTMVRFPGASHDLSRTGKPSHRVERLQHIVNWFDIYLMGKKVNDYDVAPPATPDLRAAPL
jgi:dipeptidyl aminopeptidase/acylaminoacyl peptidase